MSVVLRRTYVDGAWRWIASEVGGGDSALPDTWTVGDNGSLTIAPTDPAIEVAVKDHIGNFLLQLTEEDVFVYATGADAAIRLGIIDDSGTRPALVLTVGGTEVFKIGRDGSVHIKTGTSIVADL